jgi:hypothetical protein
MIAGLSLRQISEQLLDCRLPGILFAALLIVSDTFYPAQLLGRIIVNRSTELGGMAGTVIEGPGGGDFICVMR